MRKQFLVLLVVSVGCQAGAQAIDGTRDGLYGGAIAVQTVNTQFGDANPSGGSELDAAYAVISGSRLSVMITGNLEGNFNKLEMFFDSVPGGENVLSATPQYGSGAGGKFGGLTFDNGFTADYHLFASWGTNVTTNISAVFANRQGGGNASIPWSDSTDFSMVANVGSGQINAGDVAAGASGSALTQHLFFALNHTNTGGVAGGTGAANAAAAAAVTTGFEFSVDLADLGNPVIGSNIRIAAMISGSNHDYLSNQTLGGLPAGTGNLGGDGAGGFTGSLSGINYNNFAGNQYFEVQVVPEPASLLILGLGLLPFARRRSKR